MCLVAQLCLTLKIICTPWTIACQALLSMGVLQARILEWIAMSSSRGTFQAPEQRVEPRSPTPQADSLPSEPPEKPASLIIMHQNSQSASKEPDPRHLKSEESLSLPFSLIVLESSLQQVCQSMTETLMSLVTPVPRKQLWMLRTRLPASLCSKCMS